MILAIANTRSLVSGRRAHSLVACVLACFGKEGSQLRLRIFLLSLVLLGTILGCSRIAVAKPAGDEAFLTEYADSPAQVVSQIEANRLVALRYARVFLKDPSSVLAYFRNELSVVTLEGPMQVEIRHLDESRRIVTSTREFKAGQKVFANADGYPILEYGTGNPLTSELPARGSKPSSKPMIQAQNTPVGETPKPNAANPLAPSPAPAETAKTVLSANNPLIPTEPGSTLVASASDLVIPATPPATPIGGGLKGISGMSGWLLPLGLAAAAAGLGGGGGAPSNISGDPAGGGDPPLVPEPTSLMILGTGLMTLGVVIRRARRA